MSCERQLRRVDATTRGVVHGDVHHARGERKESGCRRVPSPDGLMPSVNRCRVRRPDSTLDEEVCRQGERKIRKEPGTTGVPGYKLQRKDVNCGPILRVRRTDPEEELTPRRIIRLNGVDTMYQDIEESVDVIAVFESGRLQPIKFRWKGRSIKIKQVTGSWKSDVGAHKIRYFAVLDGASNFFQLAYDEKNTVWVLNKIWVE